MPSDTIVILKVYPSEPGVEEAVEQAIRKIKIGKLQEIRKEPLAFGLNVIRLGVIIPEGQENLAETLVEEIKKIECVNEVEIEGMTLV